MRGARSRGAPPTLARVAAAAAPVRSGRLRGARRCCSRHRRGGRGPHLLRAHELQPEVALQRTRAPEAGRAARLLRVPPFGQVEDAA
eukprot:CAMPEP_0198426370 /NCGR_PEP_ID=MMETSP1452-20131203/5207_1 /TAXON_ID=1181717 /ORGANISM="Synchroma pusillum, Strain CCMP3072" /LENGTH=86 /DNA_ID=CAMNT_0044146743 /DNA_START=39 /DNA_END=296 /DNA_ORIENTATION=-